MKPKFLSYKTKYDDSAVSTTHAAKAVGMGGLVVYNKLQKIQEI